ncbi:DDE superfamily endonuclease, partial [Ectothiorhodospira magna]
HAAKANQSPYPWAQTIVTVGLLKSVQGRWACVPLAFAYFLRAKTTVLQNLSLYGRHLRYQSKFRQAVDMIERISQVFTDAPVLVVADSWFGNQGLMQPLRIALGNRAHLLSRLRVNAVMYDLPKTQPGKAGRPRKYGQRPDPDSHARGGHQPPAFLHDGHHAHLGVRPAPGKGATTPLRYPGTVRICVRRPAPCLGA